MKVQLCTLRGNSKRRIDDAIPSLNDFITVRCSVNSLPSLCLKQKCTTPVTQEPEQLLKNATQKQKSIGTKQRVKHTIYTDTIQKFVFCKKTKESPEYFVTKPLGFFSAKELTKNYESGSLRQRSTWEGQFLTRSRSLTLH